jgi:dipeptidyl aminopeptidase/acylaminoacyl peptidase
VNCSGSLERSGWAHLYLYDFVTGELKNTVTQGDWVVRQVVHIDQARREAYIQTGGRVSGRDPYYRDFCRVNLDTGRVTPIVSSDHDVVASNYKEMDIYYNLSGSPHELKNSNGVSPTANFYVLSKSRADEVPSSFLVNRQGEVILDVEVADISELPSNWQWPEPTKLTAADGVTDIYGLVFRPTDFSSKISYPIVTFTPSASPDFPIVPKGAFGRGINAGYDYFMAAALAEIGFVVVMIDTRGSAFRSKAFKDESYGWIESACNLDDLVAGTQQLAKRYSYMDLNRVGILTSLGGPGGLQGLLQYPEFYKVGISHQLHDSRLMSAPLWGEMYEDVHGPDAARQYPEEMVENLRGKLLLIGGMLDYITPPAAIFRVVEALQKANKDFDLLLLPSLEHDISGYVLRRIWDYLVLNLLAIEPPSEFKLTAPAFAS